MGKAKFHLRIKRKIEHDASTISGAQMARRWTESKNKQLEEAVKWCQEHNCRGQAALKIGQFPLVKDRETINRRLDGKVKNGSEREYCTILTDSEEQSIVSFAKNKNRCMQGLNKNELEKLIPDVLRIRDYTNKRLKGGRKFQTLSRNAKSALQKGKLGPRFWLRFHSKHTSLSVKRQGQVSINRALNCTRKMVCDHLDELADELIKAGIMTNAEQVDSGTWHVVFKATGITSAMAPPEAVAKIRHLLVSTAENGVSTNETFLDAAKEFDAYLTEHNVKRPVVLLSDGHGSRMKDEVLLFLFQNEIWLFITPADTTDVTQLLDQLNKIIHQQYKVAKDGLFTAFNAINREAFMIILANIWNTWVTRESLVNAARQVGITSTGLSVDFMHQDKFARAEACIDTESSEPEASSSSSVLASPILSPNKRKGSAEYWEDKFQQAVAVINGLSEENIKIDEIPGLMAVQKVKPKLTKKTTRVTQVHGSMKGRDILNTLKEMEEKKEKKRSEQDEAAQKKEEAKQAFLLCKEKCVCGEVTCNAIAMKECSVCHNILKSTCSKASCKVDGKRPAMILAAAAVAPIAKRKVVQKYESETEESDLDFSEADETDDDDGDSCNSSDGCDDGEVAATNLLKETWSFLKPPTAEEDILGKWFGVVYRTKRSSVLLVGKVLRLVDEDGPVESIEFRCLKPKSGSGTDLQDTPDHLQNSILGQTQRRAVQYFLERRGSWDYPQILGAAHFLDFIWSN